MHSKSFISNVQIDSFSIFTWGDDVLSSSPHFYCPYNCFSNCHQCKMDYRCRWSTLRLEESVFNGGKKNQKKLKRNSSLAGTKKKSGVPSWVCIIWAGCCRASCTAGIFWDFAPPFRLNTHFFGESDATLTLADATSMGNGELFQIPTIFSPPTFKVYIYLILFYSPVWMSLYCFLFSSSIFWR